MRNAPSSTDLSLIRFSLENPGDLRAGDQVYQRYSRIIRLAVREIHFPRQDEDDIVQETMGRILTHFPGFKRRRRGSFRCWVRRLARSTVIDWLKKSPRTLPLDPRSAGQAIADVVAGEFEIESLGAIISRVRLEVSPDHWDMFDQLRLQGANAQIIADKHHLSVYAVYKAIYRVSQRLKEVRAEMEGKKSP